MNCDDELNSINQREQIGYDNLHVNTIGKHRKQSAVDQKKTHYLNGNICKKSERGKGGAWMWDC